uniref:Ovule protein n=1 Tax=Panagrellus redivivus TaxID=6233 RepID=A0A7E4VCN1_PANRE
MREIISSRPPVAQSDFRLKWANLLFSVFTNLLFILFWVKVVWLARCKCVLSHNQNIVFEAQSASYPCQCPEITLGLVDNLGHES